MNYGEVKDQVLKLLNQYTRAGSPVDGSYNNQQDYLERIPGLVNDAVMEIATTARKIPMLVRLESLLHEETEHEVRYELPSNFYQLESGSIVNTKGGQTLHCNCCTILGKKYLVLPKEEAGDHLITCYRYPNLLREKPGDRDELDNEAETHYAVPFYVAAYLVIHDDPFMYATFYNKYEDKLAKMGPGVTAEVRPVADSYGFFG